MWTRTFWTLQRSSSQAYKNLYQRRTQKRIIIWSQNFVFRCYKKNRAKRWLLLSPFFCVIDYNESKFGYTWAKRNNLNCLLFLGRAIARISAIFLLANAATVSSLRSLVDWRKASNREKFSTYTHKAEKKEKFSNVLHWGWRFWVGRCLFWTVSCFCCCDHRPHQIS